MNKKHTIIMETPLFERLGGRAGITAIVDHTVDAHLKNPHVNPRFLPYLNDPERLETIKRHTVDFFVAGSGGPGGYSGRDMPTAHKGMNISAAEYMHAIDDIFSALDKQSIDDTTKKDVLAILWSLKDSIIAK